MKEVLSTLFDKTQKKRHFNRDGVKKIGIESDSAFRACLHDRNDDGFGISFQEIA